MATTFTFDGNYCRSSGEKHTYCYEAVWKDYGSDHVTWSALVRRGHYICGATRGTMEAMSTPRTLEKVRELVERSIEDLDGIRE